MLRSILISLSKAAWARNLLTRWKFARRMASRFIAGETLEQAVEVVRRLNENGIVATLDQLGENTTSTEEAITAAQGVVKIFRSIAEHDLRCNVSVKLSQIGLTIDEQLCRENLALILDEARKLDNFLRIDMEDSSLTGKTIAAYMWAREAGYENVGIVIQSYLYRSEEDIQRMGVYDTRVRLCKGAYKEPAGVAWPRKSQVDENFDKLAGLLLELAQKHGSQGLEMNGRKPPIPAFATHDQKRVEAAIRIAGELGMSAQTYEFQMLHGIRRDLQEDLAHRGYQVRIYVPFGTHWYPYYMRRLAERPANIWFFASNYFRH